MDRTQQSDALASGPRTVRIVSFGYLHGEPPAAHLTLDLRKHFRDPHALSPEMVERTGFDADVQYVVMMTPGVVELMEATAAAVTAFAFGPSATTTVVATGCAGGRHRAVTTALYLSHLLISDGFRVEVEHRDVDKAVKPRTADGEAVDTAEVTRRQLPAALVADTEQVGGAR
ncbi:ATPase [Kitasatospora sp. NPDC001309]|uniref:RapZ C-terminal domain-containing protein n=1 Tax=Kitasatospora sp. NPDC001309 TaxID=3364013 RepID=UPI0036B1B887